MPKIGGRKSILGGECTTMDMFHRRRRMSRSPRIIQRTYKKVLNFAPTSRPAATQIDFIATTGIDNASVGQLSATDPLVPTGAIVEYIEIQYSEVNLLAAANFTNIAIQYTLSGQTPIDPRLIGGNPQRNQVIFQNLWSAGLSQNSNHKIKVRIPKKFQRVKEGMIWQLSVISGGVKTDACQIIYTIKL